MKPEYDLVVRDGTVVDGTGNQPYEADVAIADGRIVGIGRVRGAGREEVDARGQLVTPGFVDIHTHYDGQVTWDNRLLPSSWHGVTTAVLGNCGIGFAPCRPADRDDLIQLMEGVEDIPAPVLREGLPWNWETFPDYMRVLESRTFDVDVGVQIPHAPLRVNVMGERGINRETATEQDIRVMSNLTCDAMKAGALGFSTSRSLAHRSSDGRPTPSLNSSEAELLGIAMSMKNAGAGVIEIVGDFPVGSDEMFEAEVGMLRRIAERSGRPLSFSLAQMGDNERWRRALKFLDECGAAGLQIKAQVAPRPVGLMLGLELALNPFSFHDSYRRISKLPLPDKVLYLRNNEFRAQLLDDQPEPDGVIAKAGLASWHLMYPLRLLSDYEPAADKTISALAVQRGVRPEILAIEELLMDEGRGMLYCALANYGRGNLDPTYEMLMHPRTLPGLGDGGAHVGMICDASFPTTLATHWPRDRIRGPKISL